MPVRDVGSRLPHVWNPKIATAFAIVAALSVSTSSAASRECGPYLRTSRCFTACSPPGDAGEPAGGRLACVCTAHPTPLLPNFRRCNTHVPRVFGPDVPPFGDARDDDALLEATFSGFTELVHVQRHAFAGIGRWMTALRLTGNRIGRLDVGAFANLTSLRLLSLSGNYLGSLGEETVALPIGDETPSLEILDLSHNVLRSLGFADFACLPRLRRLELHHNQLTTIDASWSAPPPPQSSLREVSLSHNNLQRFTQCNFYALCSLANLTSLDLRGAHWVCSCDVVWLRRAYDSCSIVGSASDVSCTVTEVRRKRSGVWDEDDTMPIGDYDASGCPAVELPQLSRLCPARTSPRCEHVTGDVDSTSERCSTEAAASAGAPTMPTVSKLDGAAFSGGSPSSDADTTAPGDATTVASGGGDGGGREEIRRTTATAADGTDDWKPKSLPALSGTSNAGLAVTLLASATSDASAAATDTHGPPGDVMTITSHRGATTDKRSGEAAIAQRQGDATASQRQGSVTFLEYTREASTAGVRRGSSGGDDGGGAVSKPADRSTSESSDRMDEGASRSYSAASTKSGERRMGTWLGAVTSLWHSVVSTGLRGEHMTMTSTRSASSAGNASLDVSPQRDATTTRGAPTIGARSFPVVVSQTATVEGSKTSRSQAESSVTSSTATLSQLTTPGLLSSSRTGLTLVVTPSMPASADDGGGASSTLCKLVDSLDGRSSTGGSSSEWTVARLTSGMLGVPTISHGQELSLSDRMTAHLVTVTTIPPQPPQSTTKPYTTPSSEAATSSRSPLRTEARSAGGGRMTGDACAFLPLAAWLSRWLQTVNW